MSSINISKLERVHRQPSGKVIARCPACAEVEGDRTGNHLVVFPDGKFGCVAHAGDSEHRRRIFALAGQAGELDAHELRNWRRSRAGDDRLKLRRKQLQQAARNHRHELILKHQWLPEDVWEDSPQRIDCDLVEYCPNYFLASLFKEQDNLWTGDVHESGGEHHGSRWRTCEHWYSHDGRIGPMTTPAVWESGAISRSAANVLAAPYTVLDFDGFDGVQPVTKEQIDRHIEDSLALVRWLRESLHWNLAAILNTGGKSIHAWFETPSEEVIQSLRDASSALGIDSGLVGRPEHPCRLPGQIHAKSGLLSHVLWLSYPPIKPSSVQLNPTTSHQ